MWNNKYVRNHSNTLSQWTFSLLPDWRRVQLCVFSFDSVCLCADRRRAVHSTWQRQTQTKHHTGQSRRPLPLKLLEGFSDGVLTHWWSLCCHHGWISAALGWRSRERFSGLSWAQRQWCLCTGSCSLSPVAMCSAAGESEHWNHSAGGCRALSGIMFTVTLLLRLRIRSTTAEQKAVCGV